MFYSRKKIFWCPISPEKSHIYGMELLKNSINSLNATKRLIPCLSLLNDSFVKTVNFKNPKYIGDPINTIKIFNEKFVDEIIIIDIGASKLNLKPNFKLLSEIASECFIPLGYGGGIKTLDDASKIINIGLKKYVYNQEFSII